MKALTIKEPWISLILSGKKTWELRSRDARMRGRIALIRKGSGTVVGVANLTATLPNLSRSDLMTNVARHQVPQHEIGLDSRWNVAWVLEGAQPPSRTSPIPAPSWRCDMGKLTARRSGSSREGQSESRIMAEAEHRH
jgi:hypothetical protein